MIIIIIINQPINESVALEINTSLYIHILDMMP